MEGRRVVDLDIVGAFLEVDKEEIGGGELERGENPAEGQFKFIEKDLNFIEKVGRSVDEVPAVVDEGVLDFLEGEPAVAVPQQQD